MLPPFFFLVSSLFEPFFFPRHLKLDRIRLCEWMLRRNPVERTNKGEFYYGSRRGEREGQTGAARMTLDQKINLIIRFSGYLFR